MKFKLFLSLTFLSTLVLSSSTAFADIPKSKAYQSFIDSMVKKHHFNAGSLRNSFKGVKIQPAILEAMAKPAEAKPWFKYREIFLTEERIASGVKFWHENDVVLQAVEHKYGVPAEYLVAIIGIESKYGEFTGKYRVIDALSTLAFAYPPRSDFFLKELEAFLLMCRKEHLNVLKPMGSYAGAMGMPQFMPSSFRSYAVDYDHNHKRDLWNSPADVSASIANYFVHNQWHTGEAVAFPVKAEGEYYKKALNNNLKPDMSISELRALRVDVPGQLTHSENIKLLSFEQANGEDLWVGLHNFYVITRYNHSPLYAMAVYQLSQAIADRIKSLQLPAELQK